ncbi:hypothetical protein UFOVP393_13 [uncultured Caudovirales phage]|jgi:hypothetical protein|uniref:Uncharacterized protein n=1 Tax=uncultured Caudovirales phage TaxID=2100421 RepID=A0A6J7X0D1_9CAUD|nr:hypothetical protein UFOVP393_13 [uncultured Caudovirales phage]
MSLEKVKMNESVSSGLVAGTRSGEGAMALGYFTIQCFDKDGNLKWEDENHNLVVNGGLQYMCGTALTSTAQITTWFIGLYGAGATNNPAAGDTMASHAGWTEVTAYSNATRPACTFASATLANPSVATNTASPAAFTINGTATVGGAFLTSSNTKGGTTGTLFSAADFASPGDRSVVSGDTINLTYTLSLAG